MPQVLQALFALAFAVFVTGSSPAQSIAVQQFGAFPNDGIDDTPAINRALARAPAGTVLQFLPGQYDMRAQDPLHHLCLTRLSGLHLRGATTGGRTSLVFHDRVQSGIVLDESTDCTVEHFDLGYAEKTFTQGVILAIDPSEMYIDVQI
ncbi:MAG: hypothetical protein KDB18_13180, partial [Salinibacterium sp.]|nr:hypothetical protein [Salinibacterium sp.]